jgi:L-threonylcarbamoyladenylate synthase
LLPGPLTFVLPNPADLYPLAGGGALGLRVPLPGDQGVARAFLQTSANLSGEADARRLADVAAEIRDGVDLVLDCGELAGVSSTVVDLQHYESRGSWRILREGAVAAASIEDALRC